MVVKIFSLNIGLQVYSEVISIKIKSKDYNLLILKDYMPIVGEIDGNFEVEDQSGVHPYENIKAYYMNNNNVFNIILKEH